MADLEASQVDCISKYQTILDNSNTEPNGQLVERVVVIPPKDRIFESGPECFHITLELAGGQRRSLYTKQLPSKRKTEQRLAKVIQYGTILKEAVFYNTLLPAMQAYCSRKDGFLMEFFPRCLRANDTGLIFEDLLARGYKLVPPLRRHTLAHAELALRTLARFHAVGYCMVQAAGGREGFITQYPLLTESIFLKSGIMLEIICNSLSTAQELLQNNREIVPDGDAVWKKLWEMQDQIHATLASIVDPSKSHHLLHTVNHGHYGCSSTLFKGDSMTGDLVSCMMQNFYSCRDGSPVLDVSSYIFMCLPMELRRQNWTRLVTGFFGQLQENVELLSLGFPYTLEQFMAEYRSKFQLAFFLNLTMTYGKEVWPELTDVPDYVSISCSLNGAKEHAEGMVAMWSEYEELVEPVHF